jgi:hypothetical protein
LQTLGTLEGKQEAAGADLQTLGTLEGKQADEGKTSGKEEEKGGTGRKAAKAIERKEETRKETEEEKEESKDEKQKA